jgi:hypothetical protein
VWLFDIVDEGIIFSGTKCGVRLDTGGKTGLDCQGIAEEVLDGTLLKLKLVFTKTQYVKNNSHIGAHQELKKPVGILPIGILSYPATKSSNMRSSIRHLLIP